MRGEARAAAALAAGAALTAAARRAEACPFCDAGGSRIVAFALIVMGTFIVAAALLLAWAARTGRLRDPQQAGRRALELDRETGVRR